MSASITNFIKCRIGEP
jgi:hypothetical protein